MTNETGQLPPPPEPELSEALARYLAGESPPEEIASLEAWLDEEPGRRRALEALDAALGSLRYRAPADLDVESALARVSARLDEPEVVPLGARRALQEPRRPRTYTTFMRAAAAVAVLLGGALVWRTAVERRGGDVPAVAAALEFETAPGQSDTILLADGTRVLLGPGSRLAAPEGYGGDAREVRLAGLALFEVVHDEARPFVVQAGGVNVRDLGTVFTVSGGDAEEVRVVVTEGTVAVGRAGAPAGGEVTLAAGDKALLPPDGEPAVERGAVTEADLAWTTGRLVLDDQPMARVAVELFRWYGIELRFAQPELAEERLTAVFEDESADEVLDAIALSLGVEIERSGELALVTPTRER